MAMTITSAMPRWRTHLLGEPAEMAMRIDVYVASKIVTCLACGEPVDRYDRVCAVNCARTVLIRSVPERGVSAGRQLA